jgi:hypothetical protein
MSKYYGRRGSQQHVGGSPSKSSKFDENLNAKTWVDFILNLRNNEAVSFGAAYESIKYESRLEYWYPKPPPMTIAQHQAWKGTLEYDVFKRQMTNILDQAGKYDEACNKACETLLSSKYMSDEVRAMVVNHPLYHKVLSNMDPTVEESEEYAIGQIKIITVNSNGDISILSRTETDEIETKKAKPLPREVLALMGDKAPTKKDREDARAEDAPYEFQMLKKPVESGIRSKNLILLMKIIRAVVLRLSPDAQQLQINELDRCWQKEQNFHTWVEIYKERVNIAAAVGHHKSNSGNCAHFLQRVNTVTHVQSVNAIYAQTPRPDWDR